MGSITTLELATLGVAIQIVTSEYWFETLPLTGTIGGESLEKDDRGIWEIHTIAREGAFGGFESFHGEGGGENQERQRAWIAYCSYIIDVVLHAGGGF